MPLPGEVRRFQRPPFPWSRLPDRSFAARSFAAWPFAVRSVPGCFWSLPRPLDGPSSGRFFHLPHPGLSAAPPGPFFWSGSFPFLGSGALRADGPWCGPGCFFGSGLLRCSGARFGSGPFFGPLPFP
ncbi:hypothetical protein SCALM49S_10323 [Streptomyces californicus]